MFPARFPAIALAQLVCLPGLLFGVEPSASVPATATATPPSAVPARGAAKAALDPDESDGSGLGLWDVSGSIRLAAGHSDNVLLSPSRPQSSGFLSTGGELTVARLPVDGTEVTLLVDGSDRRYFNGADAGTNQPAAMKQQEWVTQFNWSSVLGGRHTLAASMLYLFNDQVLDASDVDAGAGTLQAIGHHVSVTPSWRARWHPQIQTTVGLTGSRQWFRAPLSGYWEWGPRVGAAWLYRTNGSVEVAVARMSRPYDDRRRADVAGFPLVGTRLETMENRLELVWRDRWLEGGRLGTSARVYRAWREDNGSGYFDFERTGVGGAIQWREARWRAKLSVRWTHYEYPLQLLSPARPVPRWRDEWDLGLRGEWDCTRHLRLFAEAAVEESRSNLSLDTFGARTVVGGVEWEF